MKTDNSNERGTSVFIKQLEDIKQLKKKLNFKIRDTDHYRYCFNFIIYVLKY